MEFRTRQALPTKATAGGQRRVWLGPALLLSLATAVCGPQPEPLERPATPDLAMVLAWADSVDSLAAQPGARQRSFAIVWGRLISVRDSTEWPDEAEAEVLVLVDTAGRPLRHLEMPVSESGDWWLGLTHYFDERGRTSVFARNVRYFSGAEGCGDGIADVRRRTVYGPDLRVVSSELRLEDGTGQPLDEKACPVSTRYDEFFADDPQPTYDALVRAGRAPADSVSAMSDDLSPENRILGIELPTHVSALIERFGMPQEIEVPEDDPSPWGQTFRWSLQGGGDTLKVLGDDYSSTPNYRAEVNLIELRTTEDGSRTKTIYGFEFNKTLRREVEEKFEGHIERSPSYYESWGGNLKLTEEGLFTHFFFGTDGRLIAVSQGTFDRDEVD
jgi:hypothetical protein